MNLRNVESYSVGLDIGTGSVGWSVLDSKGDLCRFKGKPTWGSRIFPTAETAAETRSHRGQRRRYDRRRQRLDLLQGIFAKEMEQVDPEFFIRLNQARLQPEDRDSSHGDYRWPLFNDEHFNEKDYYAKFPTIYHLRKWLMETDECADIRLIYLSFHNIVKHRGNFLHQDSPSLSARNANMDESVERLCASVAEWCEENDIACDCSAEKIVEAFNDASLRGRAKQEAIRDALGIEKEYKKLATEISKAVVGYQADFSQVFLAEIEDSKFALSNDEKAEAFACPEEGMELYAAMRATYSSFVLMGILHGAPGETISFCKVRDYERYGRDLALLKRLVREYVPEQYDGFFKGSYYEGTTIYDPSTAQGYTKYNLGTSKLSYEDFIKEILKLFKDTEAEQDERYLQMKEEIDDGVFLRRLKTSDNGTIPYQLHLEEMDAIIERQAEFHPFLRAEKGKIESLVSFRIPYYVGPLTQKNAATENGKARFAWSKRLPGKENEKIYPWNWYEIIDRDASAEAFIRRMTGTCTYLQGEPVLPRQSLVYELFCVLNELNGAKWTQDGDRWNRFDAEDRKGILDDLFRKRKSGVTYKAVEEWLEQKHGVNGERSTGGSYHVSGGQGESRFESKLSSYCEFCSLLGVDEIPQEDFPMVEEIILWSTLFEDGDILKRKIKQNYGDRLDEKAIRRICNKRLSGWGRLSAKLLTGIKVPVDSDIEKKSIMDILLEGDPNDGKRRGRAMNLMEILHEESFGFAELIDEFNKQKMSDDFDLSDIIGSPALRRSVNQAIKIVDEISRIAGKAPDNIFIEVTRDENAKRKGHRTTRRYDAIKAALSSLKGEYASLKSELGDFKPADFDDERLVLYFMQCGKSMYSGKALDINRLSEYQVDHIIPQSYVKDDSIENKVLVLSDENQKKTNMLLIDESIRTKMGDFWRHLHDAGLIGDKKFNNLMRSHISDERMKGFINRQLVETSQIVKQVQRVLDARFESARVLPIKAGWSHQLREECGFAKCREINDFHHAHDAYIACQIGRFVLLRHSDVFDNPLKMAAVVKRFIQKQAERFRKTRLMPGSAEFIVSSFMASGFDIETGEVFRDSWNADGEIERMRRCLNYKDCFISRMPEETSGAFWKQNPISPKEAKNPRLPLKKGLDPRKYGTYTEEKYAYFFVYEAVKGAKGKRVIEFAPVPVTVAASLKSDAAALDEYARGLAESKGLEFKKVLKRKVYKYQQIMLGADRLYITGIKEVRNARQFAFTQEETELACRIEEGMDCSEEEMENLFESLQRKYARFAPRLGKQLKVADMNDSFAEASPGEKRSAILALFQIAVAHVNKIDLSSISGGKAAGCMQPSFSKELSEDGLGFYFIDQSVTGMFERRYKLGF